LQGFAGVRAYSSLPDLSRPLLESTLGFAPSLADAFAISGASRSSFYAYDPAPSSPSRPGAGTVHHVAFAATLEDHPAWRQVLLQAHAYPSPIIDRFYFRSIYFREPSGVLFELATLGPGFTVDESLEHLGEHISLPPPLEHLRSQIEPHLTPLPNPRAAWPAA
jgi:glyoxalase family protein